MPPGPWSELVALNRRTWLGITGAGIAGGLARAAGPGAGAAPAGDEPPARRGTPTRFQVASMTLPYSQFSLQRALTGIKAAGYQHVAWGTTHVTRAELRRPSSAAMQRPTGRGNWASDVATSAWNRS